MNRPRTRIVSLIGMLILVAGAFTWFGLIRRQMLHEATVGAAAKPDATPSNGMADMAMGEAAPSPSAAGPASGADPQGTPGQSQAIFVAPEKQQLIGMRSVAAEVGTLTKEIRIVGKVSYDETHVTHIHSKVSGYIEEVFADSVGKSVRAGDPLFTIYSPDLVATEQDFLLALRSKSLLRGSTVASAAQGSDNLVAAARERLRLWDVTEQDIQSLETEGKVKRAISVCRRKMIMS